MIPVEHLEALCDLWMAAFKSVMDGGFGPTKAAEKANTAVAELGKLLTEASE